MNQLGIEFGAQLASGVREPAPNLDVRPTTQVPFLQGRLGEDGTVARELSVGRWGLIPTFAKTFDSKFATFNAVSETALEKATFRNSVPRWRAAVPVSSYYEWKKSGPKRTDPKQRYEIAPAKGGDSIAFAGLFAPWRNPAIEDDAHPDAWLLSFTVLTMASPPADPARPPWHNSPACTTGSRSRCPPATSMPGWTPGTRTAPDCWTWSGARRTTSPRTGRCARWSSPKTRTAATVWRPSTTPSSETGGRRTSRA